MNSAEFQHHGQRRGLGGSLSMVLKFCWSVQGSATLVLCSCWHVYISPLPILPQGRVYTFLFMSLCMRITLYCDPRAKKKQQQAIIAIVCNTIHGIVKQAWDVNRICCQGVTVLYMWEKYESLSSHQVHLWFKTEAHTVWPSQLYHMHNYNQRQGVLFKRRMDESTNRSVMDFFQFRMRMNMVQGTEIALLWSQAWTVAASLHTAHAREGKQQLCLSDEIFKSSPKCSTGERMQVFIFKDDGDNYKNV